MEFPTSNPTDNENHKGQDRTSSKCEHISFKDFEKMIENPNVTTADLPKDGIHIYTFIKEGIDSGVDPITLYSSTIPALLQTDGVDLNEIYGLIGNAIQKTVDDFDLSALYRFTIPALLKKEDVDLNKIYKLIDSAIEKNFSLSALYEFTITALLKKEDVDLKKVYKLIEIAIDKTKTVDPYDPYSLSALYKFTIPALLQKDGVNLNEIYKLIDSAIEKTKTVDPYDPCLSALYGFTITALLQTDGVNLNKIYKWIESSIEKNVGLSALYEFTIINLLVKHKKQISSQLKKKNKKDNDNADFKNVESLLQHMVEWIQSGLNSNNTKTKKVIYTKLIPTLLSCLEQNNIIFSDSGLNLRDILYGFYSQNNDYTNYITLPGAKTVHKVELGLKAFMFFQLKHLNVKSTPYTGQSQVNQATQSKEEIAINFIKAVLENITGNQNFLTDEEIKKNFFEEDNILSIYNKTKDTENNIDNNDFLNVLGKITEVVLKKFMYLPIDNTNESTLSLISFTFFTGYITASDHQSFAFKDISEIADHIQKQLELAKKSQEDSQTEKNKTDRKPLSTDIKSRKGDKAFTVTLSPTPKNSPCELLAGYISDTCFIKETIPHNVEVVNIDHNGKIRGNLLLIHSHDQYSYGNPVVIIRAINPTETFARDIDCEALLEAIIEYAHMNYPESTLCVAVGHQRDGCGTNRQPVWGALEKLSQYWTNAQGVIHVGSDATFNRYDVNKHNLYVVYGPNNNDPMEPNYQKQQEQ